jgi:hypothetical protein
VFYLADVFCACLQRARRVVGLALVRRFVQAFNLIVASEIPVASLQTAWKESYLLNVFCACLRQARRAFGLALVWGFSQASI